jgi:hypothetical protein
MVGETPNNPGASSVTLNQVISPIIIGAIEGKGTTIEAQLSADARLNGIKDNQFKVLEKHAKLSK